MPSLSDLLFPKQRVRIYEQLSAGDAQSVFDFVELDATEQEDHQADNDVTEYPVERGANIADHSRPRPQMLTLRGRVTGTPFDLLAIAIPPPLKARRGKAAYDKLDKWRREGQRVAVVTSLRDYIDFIIASISVPRNVRNSDGVEMTIQLKQIFTASALAVDKPTRNVDPSLVRVGPKPALPANPAQNNFSTTLKLLSDGVTKAMPR